LWLDAHSVGEQVEPFRFVGGTDWKLSSKQYATFLIALATGVIAPKSKLWNRMVQEELGLEPKGDEKFGIVGHGGYGIGTPLATGWLCGPSLIPGQGVIAVVESNSHILGNDSGVEGLLVKAYLES